MACQFSRCGDYATLGDFIPVRGVYPAGRLDANSEGLLVLTDSGDLQHRIAHPCAKLPKTYWAQVEGEPAPEQLAGLASGIDLGDFVTRPARVRVLPEPPGLWVRDPPIRYRKTVPTAWLELVLVEGRNRQVRRMTAAVGLPTLRLVRWRIGHWSIDDLAPGEWRDVDVGALQKE